MSFRAADRREGGRSSREAGFMLLEVLVALVIATLLLGVIGRALAQGWRSTRIPLDIVTAVTLARAELQGGPDEPPHAGAYTVARRIRIANLVARPSPVPPPPALAAVATSRPGVPQGPKPNDVMPGVTEHPDAAGAARTGQLQWIDVTVRTPAGRTVRLETVRLDATPN